MRPPPSRGRTRPKKTRRVSLALTRSSAPGVPAGPYCSERRPSKPTSRSVVTVTGSWPGTGIGIATGTRTRFVTFRSKSRCRIRGSTGSLRTMGWAAPPSPGRGSRR